MNLVLPVRKGGLGNQLFQVAAAMIYGEETGKTVIFSKEQAHIHRVHPHPYEESIFQGFQILNASLDANVIQNLCQNDFSLYPGEPCFESWTCKPQDGSVILHGYFQYAPPLLKHKDLISSTFLKNLKKISKGRRSHTDCHSCETG